MQGYVICRGTSKYEILNYKDRTVINVFRMMDDGSSAQYDRTVVIYENEYREVK